MRFAPFYHSLISDWSNARPRPITEPPVTGVCFAELGHTVTRVDLERLEATMRTPVLFDGRNQWSPVQCARPASSTTAPDGRRK